MKVLRKVIITGGTRGIGLSIAKKFAESAVELILIAKSDSENASRQADELRKLGAKVEIIMCDIGEENEVIQFVNWFNEHHLTLDVLINNAGVNRVKTLEDTELEDWDYVMKVNLRGPFLLTKLLFANLAQSSNPRVVNVSSVSSLIHGPKSIPYAVSKAGLNSLTKLFARYGAPMGILVNAVAPGLVLTDLTQREIDDGADLRYIEMALLKKLTTVSEISDLVYFLSSETQKNITGQVISTSGGAFLG